MKTKFTNRKHDAMKVCQSARAIEKIHEAEFFTEYGQSLISFADEYFLTVISCCTLADDKEKEEEIEVKEAVETLHNFIEDCGEILQSDDAEDLLEVLSDMKEMV